MGGNGSSDKPPKAPGNANAKRPPPAISETDKAILDIKRQRGRLIKSRDKLDEEVVKLYAGAVKFKASGQSDRARTILKLRRSKIKLSENLVGYLAKLDSMQTLVEAQQQQNE